MKMTAQELGRRGERRAAWFYRLRGFRIVARNLRLQSGELDLVARRGRLLVIAEVKTRRSLAAGEGFEAVDREKQLRLIRLADAYLAREQPRGITMRYDVLSLFWTGRRFVLTHFADAFRPVADPRAPWKWTV
jgi:putative endonuclease